MTRLSLIICLFFFGATSLCVLGDEQVLCISDVDAVRQARSDQNKALATCNSERVASFWTDDITLRCGLGASVIGKEAYRALVDANLNDKRLIYLREPSFIEVSPDWPLAFESGTWTARCGDRESPPLITGRYSAHWVKQEGRWLIRSELFVALTCNDNACILSSLP